MIRWSFSHATNNFVPIGSNRLCIYFKPIRHLISRYLSIIVKKCILLARTKNIFNICLWRKQRMLIYLWLNHQHGIGCILIQFESLVDIINTSVQCTYDYAFNIWTCVFVSQKMDIHSKECLLQEKYTYKDKSWF